MLYISFSLMIMRLLSRQRPVLSTRILSDNCSRFLC